MTTIDLIKVLGVNIHPIRIKDLHQQIDKFIEDDRHALILNVNVNCLNIAYKNTWLRSFLNKSDIVFCDGAGVMLGAKLLGKTIPERITYADWIWKLAELANDKDYSLYLLGAMPGIAELAAEKLVDKFPDLKILGTHNGYFDKSIGSVENEIIIKEINKLSPNILILGFGMPDQERWLMENWKRLDSNIALTGGAVFDYVSGELRRAPNLLTRNKMEWFGRFFIEPKRLWKRYLIGNPLFIFRILKEKYCYSF